MDYQKTVNHVMSFLKEKGVCSSSRKSHQECYAALGEYLQTTGQKYNETVRDAWFSVMKTRYSSNKCVFWEQYIFQLEEISSTGSMSMVDYLKKYDVTDSVPAATLCQVPSPEYGRSATDLTGLRQRFLFPG